MAGSWPTEIKRETETLESVFFNFVNRTQGGQRNARSGNRHMWKIRITTPFLERANYQKLFAFGVKQEGRFETFTISSSIFGDPLGEATGSGKVVGTINAGLTSIDTDGWGNNITSLFKEGDLIKFANHKKVYMVVEDASSNGSGEATLTIKPSLVAALSDNEDITYSDVPFTMAFTKDPFPVETNVARHAKYEIEMEEVWNS